MTGPTPYLSFPGTARQALELYRDVFGGELTLATFAEMGRTDGPGELIGHGMLQGPVELFASDSAATSTSAVAGGGATFHFDGLMFALLGTAEPAVLERWFAALSEGGEVVDPLQARPWGDHDGQVRDRFGLLWLLGYQG